MNQHERILKYIEDFGSITPMDAIADLGCTKLATRVSELISAGYPIKKQSEAGKNRYGEATHYMRYTMGK